MSGARVGLATCEKHDGFVAGDDEALGAQLAALGFEPVRVRWDDPGVEWGLLDAVLIRTTWDYHKRLGEFLAWLDGASRRTRVFNAPEIVRGNVDKRYLRVLESAGVPIVPTGWVEADAGGFDRALDVIDAREGVIKPAVGAGASGMLVFGAGEIEGARAHAWAQARACGAAMVQALVGSVRTRGELSVVLIDGEVSHAVRKRPEAGDWRVQIEFGGRYEVEDAGERERGVAAAAVAALCGGRRPLYARIDLVELGGGGVAVMEAELVEPELFLAWAPEGGERLGRALGRRLGIEVG